MFEHREIVSVNKLHRGEDKIRRQRTALERRATHTHTQGREIQKDEISRVRVWCFHLEPRLAIYYANNPFHPPASLGV